MADGVRWFEVSGNARVEARGGDAAKFLHNLCSNDILRLPLGGVCEACFCNAKGGIVEHGWVRKAAADSLWIDLDSGRGAALVKHLDRYIFREQVALAERTAETCLFHACGPGAEAAATALASLCRSVHPRPRTAEAGFDLLADAEQRDALRAALGEGELAAAAAEALRVAAGIPVCGIDFPDGALPQELDRTATAISFTKGCYIGQETVARIDAYGHVNKTLRGLVLAGPAATGAPILLGEKEVGKLGSVAQAADGRWLALAVLRTAATEPGTAVMAGGVSATVSALPMA